MENYGIHLHIQIKTGDILLAADKIGLPAYGLPGRNIMLIHFWTNIFLRKPRFWQKRKNGWTFTFSGKSQHSLHPLHPAGSDFRQAVWPQIIRKIPYGQTIATYREIARQLAVKQEASYMSALGRRRHCETQ